MRYIANQEIGYDFGEFLQKYLYDMARTPQSRAILRASNRIGYCLFSHLTEASAAALRGKYIQYIFISTCPPIEKNFVAQMCITICTFCPLHRWLSRLRASFRNYRQLHIIA